MNSSKALRIGGFTLAVGVTASLVGFAATGTGAYFTDSHPGTINASTGHVAVSPDVSTLDFANLSPGEYKTQTVNYSSSTTSALGEDIWLVFPTGASGTTGTAGTNTAYGSNPSEAFTGNPDDGSGRGQGALGRYGHFAVTSTNNGSGYGAGFTSYNLSNPGTTPSHTGAKCGIDGNGNGGSTAQPASPSDTSSAFCAPSTQILLASALQNNQTGSATFTFGPTPLVGNNGEDIADHLVVKYKIVATQHGIAPDNQFNDAGINN